MEAHIGIANGAHQASVEIDQAIDVIDDFFFFDIVEQAVDGEVATARVLIFFAEHVVAADQQIVAGVFFFFARVGAEGRGLDDLVAEEHVGEPKSSTDDAAIAKDVADLVGRRAGGDVEILGPTAD